MFFAREAKAHHPANHRALDRAQQQGADQREKRQPDHHMQPHGRHIGFFDPQNARHKHVPRDQNREIGRRVIRPKPPQRCATGITTLRHLQEAGK